jgi:hypothetical protein|tara:strand:+ start:186 stop:431 length:246 start_codon:yes stop_codon:yes gene_type:complete
MRKILVLFGISNYAESNFNNVLAFPAYFKSTLYLADVYHVNSSKVISSNINKFLKEENIKQFKKLVIKITLKKSFIVLCLY